MEKEINPKVVSLRRYPGAFVAKPVDPEEIFGLVARLIGGASR
jgi:hypothetical protein